MTLASLFQNNLVYDVAVWSALTIAIYAVAKWMYRRWHRWWLMPVAVTPALLIAVVLALHVRYEDYSSGTHWLVALLGPVTVAFAVPIYEQRALIRKHWPVLLVGMLVGSATAVVTSWGLASLLGVDGALRLSLVPRSISTPFAMEVAERIGGIPNLAALFVVLTGVLGSIFGEFLIIGLRIRSPLAKGALFGVGAHGIGTAKAHELGAEEGSVAGLVMVLVGLLNVMLASVYSCV